MEEICSSIAVWLSLTFIGRIVGSLFERYSGLSVPDLHFRMFLLSAISPLPILIVIHLLSRLDYGGYFPFYQCIYVLGFPLILLGDMLANLLTNTFPFELPSLRLWVYDILFVLQWILWGQLLAVVIRLRRQVDPTTGRLDPIARVTITAGEGIGEAIGGAIDEPYQEFTARYGKRQVEAIFILAGGLLFLLLVCLLVVYSLD